MIEDLELFKGPLKEIMEKELAVGNEIKEIWTEKVKKEKESITNH